MLMRKHSARGAQPAFPVASNLGYLWPSDIAPVLDKVRRYSNSGNSLRQSDYL